MVSPWVSTLIRVWLCIQYEHIVEIFFLYVVAGEWQMFPVWSIEVADKTGSAGAQATIAGNSQLNRRTEVQK